MLVPTVGSLHKNEREHLLVWIRSMREATLKQADQKLQAMAAKLAKPVLSKADYEAVLKELNDVAGLGHSLKFNADGARKRVVQYVKSAGDQSPLNKKK